MCNYTNNNLTDVNNKKRTLLFILFFSFVLMTYVLQFIEILNYFFDPEFLYNDLEWGIKYVISLCLCIISCCFGLLWSVKRRLSSARVGVVMTIYFLGMRIYAFGYLPLFAAVATFILLCKEKKSVICITLILATVIMGIVEEFQNIYYVMTESLSLFGVVLSIRDICIYLLFLYQITVCVIYQDFFVGRERFVEKSIIQRDSETRWHLILTALLVWNILLFLYVEYFVPTISLFTPSALWHVCEEITHFLLLSFLFLPIICAIGAVIAFVRIFRSSKWHKIVYIIWIAVMASQVYFWNPICDGLMSV